jgi:hypothetical protein
MKLPVEFRQPVVTGQARRNLSVAGFDIRDVIVGDLATARLPASASRAAKIR